MGFAILFANNVSYDSGDRSPQGVERDAAELVGEFAERHAGPR